MGGASRLEIPRARYSPKQAPSRRLVFLKQYYYLQLDPKNFHFQAHYAKKVHVISPLDALAWQTAPAPPFKLTWDQNRLTASVSHAVPHMLSFLSHDGCGPSSSPSFLLYSCVVAYFSLPSFLFVFHSRAVVDHSFFRSVHH